MADTQFQTEWRRFVNVCTKHVDGRPGSYAAAQRGEWVFVIARGDKAQALRRAVKRWGGEVQSG